MNALGVNVPALYIGQSDYVLTVSDEISEVFDITASRDGKPIITGHGFRGPECGVDPRDDSPERFAAMFGAFLAGHLESPESPDSWTIYDNGPDLASLADACAIYGEDGDS